MFGIFLSPPVPVAVDSSGLSVPGEVPKLFGGNVVEYLKATGSEIPLIVASCIRAIDKEGEQEMWSASLQGCKGLLSSLYGHDVQHYVYTCSSLSSQTLALLFPLPQV